MTGLVKRAFKDHQDTHSIAMVTMQRWMLRNFSGHSLEQISHLKMVRTLYQDTFIIRTPTLLHIYQDTNHDTYFRTHLSGCGTYLTGHFYQDTFIRTSLTLFFSFYAYTAFMGGGNVRRRHRYYYHSNNNDRREVGNHDDTLNYHNIFLFLYSQPVDGFSFSK